MKMTPQILSIPPYLSTAWKNISALHVRGQGQLVVVLQNGVQIEIPGLDKETLLAIFEAHSKYAERQDSSSESLFRLQLPLPSNGQVIDSLGPSMQHNPEQANLPPLPPPVLEKVALVAKAFGLEDTSVLPQSEPDCNCVFCQVVRTLKNETPAPEEEVVEADLHFCNWSVSQQGEKLYHVINPLDKTEQYDVFLGDPLGCTCGSKNCEHIKAVLNT